MVYDARNHDAVVALARRGIVSAICSKNDPDLVRRILIERGIWDYFVFPSIAWEPKGPRLAALVEAIQLRPGTVLFIDDNPLNREEARHFVPGLQVADETVLPTLLDDPLLAGKDDRALTRLAQYRLLEQRAGDLARSSGEVADFLRGSTIRISIDYDIDAHIDRAVELINRTNQLNFTKQRLPEDRDAARAALRKAIDHYDVQSGLVRVRDSYGDYGFVGFYALRAGDGRRDLLHFCFSCRTLNMGIETWVYRHLQKPSLAVVGEVLADLHDPAPIDWITLTPPGDAVQDASALPVGRNVGRVVLRGGCEMEALAHYVSAVSDSVVGEFNIVRDRIQMRLEHSLVMRQILEGAPPELMPVLRRFGYRPEDIRTALFDPAAPPDVCIFSFTTDAMLQVYRHRSTGLRLPFVLPGHLAGGWNADLTQIGPDALDDEYRAHWAADAVALLAAEFERQPFLDEAGFKEILHRTLLRLGPAPRVFLMTPNDRYRDDAGNEHIAWSFADLASWINDVAAGYPNVTVLAMRDFIRDESEIETFFHFSRMVYVRIFERIMGLESSACAP